MSIGSILPVGSSLPQPVSKGPVPVKQATAPAVVQPVKVDADGDHDGTVGTMINVVA